MMRNLSVATLQHMLYRARPLHAIQKPTSRTRITHLAVIYQRRRANPQPQEERKSYQKLPKLLSNRQPADLTYGERRSLIS